MTFNHQEYTNKFISQPNSYLDPGYGIKISRGATSGLPNYYKIIGIHHLKPQENVGKHHLFIDVLDENDKRIYGQAVGWGWHGQRPDEQVRPAIIDKPLSEPGTNLALGINQLVFAWIEGKNSDTITGVSTKHPDEGSGNTLGHHSFYVVWKRTKLIEEPEPTPVPEPVPTPTHPDAHRYMLEIRDLVEEYFNASE